MTVVFSRRLKNSFSGTLRATQGWIVVEESPDGFFQHPVRAARVNDTEEFPWTSR
ncbi:MAG: hypothetical protein KKE83_03750 [Proteobacteria bacterium]|nr:hypothetical protein [Pseudomonadota bacterium]